ncbi:hypothetical protein FoTM2_010787 [Fusarium oxysporum f. sp. vasinfectum]|nr:hypothetical protein FoTM2_010787 [Fusarium oxysporum f. sp. vasinfectum]
MGNWMFEEADITASVVQPFDSSTLNDTVTRSPPHRRADSDTLVDCDFLDGALEGLETSEHARLQELTIHNSPSWRPVSEPGTRAHQMMQSRILCISLAIAAIFYSDEK